MKRILGMNSCCTWQQNFHDSQKYQQAQAECSMYFQAKQVWQIDDWTVDVKAESHHVRFELDVIVVILLPAIHPPTPAICSPQLHTGIRGGGRNSGP